MHAVGSPCRAALIKLTSLQSNSAESWIKNTRCQQTIAANPHLTPPSPLICRSSRFRMHQAQKSPQELTEEAAACQQGSQPGAGSAQHGRAVGLPATTALGTASSALITQPPAAGPAPGVSLPLAASKKPELLHLGCCACMQILQKGVGFLLDPSPLRWHSSLGSALSDCMFLSPGIAGQGFSTCLAPVFLLPFL